MVIVGGLGDRLIDWSWEPGAGTAQELGPTGMVVTEPVQISLRNPNLQDRASWLTGCIIQS